MVIALYHIFAIILQAITLLLVLVYIHSVFSKQPTNCLRDVENEWPKDGILRVEIISNVSKNYSLEESYKKEYGPLNYQYLYGENSDILVPSNLTSNISDDVNTYMNITTTQEEISELMASLEREVAEEEALAKQKEQAESAVDENQSPQLETITLQQPTDEELRMSRLETTSEESTSEHGAAVSETQSEDQVEVRFRLLKVGDFFSS